MTPCLLSLWSLQCICLLGAERKRERGHKTCPCRISTAMLKHLASQGDVECKVSPSTLLPSSLPLKGKQLTLWVSNLAGFHFLSKQQQKVISMLIEMRFISKYPQTLPHYPTIPSSHYGPSSCSLPTVQVLPWLCSFSKQFLNALQHQTPTSETQ